MSFETKLKIVIFYLFPRPWSTIKTWTHKALFLLRESKILNCSRKICELSHHINEPLKIFFKKTEKKETATPTLVRN